MFSFSPYLDLWLYVLFLDHSSASDVVCEKTINRSENQEVSTKSCETWPCSESAEFEEVAIYLCFSLPLCHVSTAVWGIWLCLFIIYLCEIHRKLFSLNHDCGMPAFGWNLDALKGNTKLNEVGRLHFLKAKQVSLIREQKLGKLEIGCDDRRHLATPP